MKKGIYLALSMMLVLGAFTACGGGKDKDNDTSTPDSVTSEDVGGSEGGEDQKPVIPEDLDVAGAIAIGKDYASKVTHGKLVNFTDAYYDNTENVLYAFGSDFTYVKSTTVASWGEETYETWNSLDKNGNIFSVQNEAPNPYETSVEMMNGYGFNLSYLLGDYQTVYGLDALIATLYETARNEYAYYEQCLEDAELAGDDELIANVQYVMDNCGFTESVSEGVYSFTMTYKESEGSSLYFIAAEFTLNEEGYIATAKVESTCYDSEGYTTESKTIVKADEELGIAEVTANVYALKEEVEFDEEVYNEETEEWETNHYVGPPVVSKAYTIDATQNGALTEEDVIPTENAYSLENLLVEEFTLAQNGEEVVDGASLSVQVGTTISLDITVDESKMAFSSMFFKLNGEVMVDAYMDDRFAVDHSTYNYEILEKENVLNLMPKQEGTYVLTVIYGNAIKTLNVAVTPVSTTELNASAYVDYSWVNGNANVYVGTALEMKVEANEYADASHTYEVVSANADNMTLTLNEDGTYNFISNVAGTYEIKFISIYSTADNEIATTMTIVVEEAPSVAEILNGSYELKMNMFTYTVSFAPESDGATSGTVTVAMTSPYANPYTDVYTYEYNAGEIVLTYAGDATVSEEVALILTDSYGLKLSRVAYGYDYDLSKVEEVVETADFASELYYDQNADLYLIVNKEEKLAFICSTTNPTAFENEYSMMISYTISLDGTMTVTMIRSMTADFFNLTGTGNYYASMDAAEIGYVHPMTSMNMNFWFEVVTSEEGGEGEGNEGNEGNEGEDVINVTTTDTYCWVDKYTFTAEKAGTYTFTVPAGLGVWEAEACDTNSADPEIDYYANESGYTFSLTLAEGEEFSFYVAATTRGDWVISYVA